MASIPTVSLMDVHHVRSDVWFARVPKPAINAEIAARYGLWYERSRRSVLARVGARYRI